MKQQQATEQRDAANPQTVDKFLDIPDKGKA